jgi:hypothetical protein
VGPGGARAGQTGEGTQTGFGRPCAPPCGEWRASCGGGGRAACPPRREAQRACTRRPRRASSMAATAPRPTLAPARGATPWTSVLTEQVVHDGGWRRLEWPVAPRGRARRRGAARAVYTPRAKGAARPTSAAPIRARADRSPRCSGMWVGCGLLVCDQPRWAECGGRWGWSRRRRGGRCGREAAPGALKPHSLSRLPTAATRQTVRPMAMPGSAHFLA